MTVLDRQETDLVELFSKAQIQERIETLAAQINNDFAKNNSSDEPLYVIGVLKGSVLFVTDLIRHLNMPVQVEFIRIASYGNEQQSSGQAKPVDLTLPNLTGKNVLIVEDIVDTGLTANFIVDYIKMQHSAKSIQFATLLDKECARVHSINIDYVGFPVDNKFVVGYGLDYSGFFRNLPYIGYFPQ